MNTGENRTVLCRSHNRQNRDEVGDISDIYFTMFFQLREQRSNHPVALKGIRVKICYGYGAAKLLRSEEKCAVAPVTFYYYASWGVEIGCLKYLQRLLR